MSAVCGVRCKFQVQYYVPNARVPRWYQCQKNSNYRPPTKLWEGNVFICVCPSVNLSVHRRSHVTITYDALDLTVQGSTPSPGPFGHQTWDPKPQSPCLWHLVVITGDLFWLVHLRIPMSNIWWWLLKHIQSAQAGRTLPAGMFSFLN